jgi:hypothetical protein
MNKSPEGGEEFLKRRFSQEIQKFREEVVEEVFGLCSTHFILEQEQSKHVIQFFIEAIQEALSAVKFSSNFGFHGSVGVQVRDSEFWKLVANSLKYKLSSISHLEQDKINILYHYFYEVSTRKCCPEEEPRVIGLDRMP